jgi:dienelactone hydrolase
MTSARFAFLALLLASLSACGEATDTPASPAAEPVRLDDGTERRDVRFPCGGGTCAGWLYLPAGVEKPAVVVMGHGFAGTRDVALPRFAERFARAGLAALVLDYRHFGASGGLPRQLVDPWRQLEDWRAALAFVRSYHAVDGGRVAVWGTSLGGGLALVTAADESGVAAVVAQVPLVDSSQEGEATFYGFGWLARLLFTAWGDLALSALGRGPISIPAIVPAGGFGMIVDDAAYAAFEKLVEPGSSYRNEVVAHSIFTFDGFDPAARTSEIRVPVLLVASRSDRFAPFAAAEAFVREAPDARLAEIDGDHFDVYSSPILEQAARLASNFLTQYLQ